VVAGLEVKELIPFAREERLEARVAEEALGPACFLGERAEEEASGESSEMSEDSLEGSDGG